MEDFKEFLKDVTLFSFQLVAGFLVMLIIIGVAFMAIAIIIAALANFP
jgi:hypothetical protein